MPRSGTARLLTALLVAMAIAALGAGPFLAYP